MRAKTSDKVDKNGYTFFQRSKILGCLDVKRPRPRILPLMHGKVKELHVPEEFVQDEQNSFGISAELSNLQS
eukprot:s114_g37.t1